MKIKLAEHAIEQSAYGIEVSFADSEGEAATPKTLKWSLTDTGGNVINSRQYVVVGSPSSTQTIVLRGDDLQLLAEGNRSEARLLIVDGTYDDDTLGADTPFHQEIQFVIDAATDIV